MSDFQNLFRAYLERHKLTIYRLSKDLHIDRSTLYQVQSGARPPTAQIFRRLAAYFKLSPQEERQWLESWKRARMAPRSYQLLQQVESCIQTLEQCPGEGPAPLPVRRQVTLDVPSGTCLYREGRGELLRLLQALSEACLCPRQQNPVDVHLPAPQREGPFSQFPLFPGGLRVRQLFPLAHPDEQRTENISAVMDALGGILSRFFSSGGGQEYTPYIYCPSGGEDAGPSNLFPYYVITDRHVLLLSEQLDRGLLLSDPLAAQAYRRQFELALGQADPLFRCYDSPIQAMREIVSQGSGPGQPPLSAHFFPQPCLMMYADQEIISHGVQPALPNREQLVAFATSCYVDNQAYGRGYYNFFTRQGVAAFLEGGVMQEFPDYLVRPLPLEDRLTLIHRLRDCALLGEGNIHCVDPRLVSVPEYILIDVCFGRQLLFSHSRPDALNYLVVSEPSLVRCFLDYFRALPSMPGVFSREESAAVLDELLARYG